MPVPYSKFVWDNLHGGIRGTEKAYSINMKSPIVHVTCRLLKVEFIFVEMALKRSHACKVIIIIIIIIIIIVIITLLPNGVHGMVFW